MYLISKCRCVSLPLISSSSTERSESLTVDGMTVLYNQLTGDDEVIMLSLILV